MDLKQSGEDYLEAVLNIERKKGVVRSIDVADYLNVSKPSVTRAMGVLKNAGYIQQEPYGDISLTDIGRERAKAIFRRHVILTKFFSNVLNVDDVIAEEDACKVEHVISQETMDKLTDYLVNFKKDLRDKERKQKIETE